MYVLSFDGFRLKVTEEKIITGEIYFTDEREKIASLDPIRVISKEMAKSSSWGELPQMTRSAYTVLRT